MPADRFTRCDECGNPLGSYPSLIFIGGVAFQCSNPAHRFLSEGRDMYLERRADTRIREIVREEIQRALVGRKRDTMPAPPCVTVPKGSSNPPAAECRDCGCLACVCALRVTTDPDKMHGAGDQFPSSDYQEGDYDK